jgi:hypothetical protein
LGYKCNIHKEGKTRKQEQKIGKTETHGEISHMKWTYIRKRGWGCGERQTE